MARDIPVADRVAVMHKGRVEQFDHPQAIYERPASLFVAGFVGSPATNFLEGRLSGAGRGATLDVTAYAFEGVAPADAARLGVRCEDIAVVERGTPESLPATFAFTELLGADALGWFDCQGKRFNMRLGIAAARSMDKEVGLRFDMAKASLFSASTERRL